MLRCVRRMPRSAQLGRRAFSSLPPLPGAGSDPRQVTVYRRISEHMPYAAALKWMEDLVDAKTRKQDPYPRDMLFVVQHAPVYTLGKAATTDHVLFPTDETCPFELHRLERGGEVTYHGPGQLTIYPVLALERHRRDLHWYVQQLELLAGSVLARHGIAAAGDPSNPGVWVGSDKVAALGVKVRRWVTMHGLALNVEPQCLDGFARIVPCGIQGKGVTSLQTLLEARAQGVVLPSPADAAATAAAATETAASPGERPTISPAVLAAAAVPATGSDLDAVADDVIAEFSRLFDVVCVEDPEVTAHYDADPDVKRFFSPQQ